MVVLLCCLMWVDRGLAIEARKKRRIIVELGPHKTGSSELHTARQLEQGVFGGKIRRSFWSESVELPF